MYLYVPANNLILKGSGITASSQNTYFPVANITHHIAADVWRSVTSGGSHVESLVIDLGGLYDQTDFPNGLDLLIDSNNSVECSLSGFHGGFLNGASVITGFSAAANDGPLRINLPLGTPGNKANSLNVYVTVNGGGQFFQVGKMFLGVPIDTGDQGGPGNNGFKRVYAEYMNSDTAVLGQNYAEQRASYWAATIDVPYMTEAIASVMRQQLYTKLGTHTPFWVVVDPSVSATAELGLPRYVKQTQVPAEQMVGYGTGWLWGVHLALASQL